MSSLSVDAYTSVVPWRAATESHGDETSDAPGRVAPVAKAPRAKAPTAAKPGKASAEKPVAGASDDAAASEPAVADEPAAAVEADPPTGDDA